MRNKSHNKKKKSQHRAAVHSLESKRKAGLGDRELAWMELLLPTTSLVASLMGSWEFKKQTAQIESMGMLCWQCAFVLRLFICLWPAWILGEVSGEGLNRIFISFPGMAFAMLVYQNVYRGVKYFLVSFIFKECYLKRDQDRSCSAPEQSRMCKTFAPKCPWLGKIKPCNSIAGCKLLKLPLFNYFVSVSLIPLVKGFPQLLTILPQYNNTRIHTHLRIHTQHI